MSGKKNDKSGTDCLRKAAIAEIQDRIDSPAQAAEDAPTAPTVPADAAAMPETPSAITVAGPDGGGAPGTKGKKGAKAKPTKVAKPAKAPKEKKAKPPKEPKSAKPKKVSGLDAAAIVLEGAKEPMSAKEIMSDILTRKLWTTKGETPEATLYAAMIREIAAKKGEARFVKVDRGRFTINKKA